jgi:hypothetical protein
MRRTLLFFIAGIAMSISVFAQDDRFSQLNESNLTGFGKPLVTALGSGINTGAFYSADIPSTFGFSFSIRTMLISVPDDQLTFTPSLPDGYTASEKTPTFFGKKQGASYAGQYGYVAFPGGIDETSIPFAMPQITASFMGTEALIRFVPTIKAGGEEFSFFGIGLKHKISQYIPLLPLDVAVQVLYNRLKFSDIVKGNNIAANIQASKKFGLFTAYSGLQYESSSFDFNYTFKGDPNSLDPSLKNDKKISASIDGDNNFRFILGGAVKLAMIVINADINVSSQTIYSTGLSFEF